MGKLYLVSTPIGNLEDISIRALKILFSVDYIAAEDTRISGNLLRLLITRYSQTGLISQKKHPELIKFYDEIEFKQTPIIIDLLQNDKDIALISDSGTPLVADPGFKLIQTCLKNNIEVIPVPGASALLTALVASGFGANNFHFLGFLPKSVTKKQQLFNDLKATYQNNKILQHPVIIAYETPHRLVETLKLMKQIYGDLPIVIARELTKIHEEIKKGTIENLISYFSTPKGEFVILWKE